MHAYVHGHWTHVIVVCEAYVLSHVLIDMLIQNPIKLHIARRTIAISMECLCSSWS